MIDHFCVSVDIVAVVSRVFTVDVGNNLSDRLPVEITLHASDLLTPSVNGNHNVKDDVMYQLRRDKANLHDYDMLTSYYLDAIGLGYAHIFQSCAVNCTCGKLWLIDKYYRKIVCALTTADALCIPRKNRFLQVLVRRKTRRTKN